MRQYISKDPTGLAGNNPNFYVYDSNTTVDPLGLYVSKRDTLQIGGHDDHKSKWNIHTGYWSFESYALVKILGLDDIPPQRPTILPLRYGALERVTIWNTQN